MLRFVLGAGAALAAVVVLMVLAGSPEDRPHAASPSANAIVDDHRQGPAPISRHSFANPAFSVHAPEGWHLLTRSDLRELAKKRGKSPDKMDKIIGLLVTSKGDNGRGMVIFAKDDTKGTPMKKLNAFDLGVSFAWLFNPAGRKAKVTTDPYAHDLAGVNAASMVLETQTRKDSEIDLGITMIELPGRPLIALLVTRGAQQRSEAEPILASFAR